jgi:hypothetical protein
VSKESGVCERKVGCVKGKWGVSKESGVCQRKVGCVKGKWGVAQQSGPGAAKWAWRSKVGVSKLSGAGPAKCRRGAEKVGCVAEESSKEGCVVAKCDSKVGCGAAKESAAQLCEEWRRKVASTPACRQKGFQFEFQLYVLGDPSLGYSDEDNRQVLSTGTVHKCTGTRKGTEYRYITIAKRKHPKKIQK